jgi:hypothetical protein
MREEIVNALKQARDAGEVRAGQVRSIVHDAVSKAAAGAKEGAMELREIARDAASAGIEELEKAGDATKERITAAVEGAVDGVSDIQEKVVGDSRRELSQLKSRLKEEEERLSASIREGFGRHKGIGRRLFRRS